MATARRILILGATGMLGRALLSESKCRGGTAVGAARSGADLSIDLCSARDLARAFQMVRPDIVINAAAETDIDACERDPGRAYLVNARAVSIIAGLADLGHAYLVQVSTDHFFSGDRALKHDEGAPVRLLNEYSRTKYAGEQFALTLSGSLVVRTNIVGFRGLPEKPTFAEWALESLRAGKSMELYSDYFTSSIDVGQFSAALYDLLPAHPSGLLNLASAEVTSKKDFVEALAAAAKMDTKSCRTGSVRKKGGPARAESLGLDVSRAERLLGRPLPRLNSVIANLLVQYFARA